MIRNRNTEWHELADARRPKKAGRRLARLRLPEPPGGVRPDPDGSFEERCAWVRLRQARKRKANG